jgi:hypothetical protein
MRDLSRRGVIGLIGGATAWPVAANGQQANPARGGLHRSHPQGRKAVDLPVQAPTKYELMLNLKTANALGLDLPPTVLARDDKVIQ